MIFRNVGGTGVSRGGLGIRRTTKANANDQRQSYILRSCTYLAVVAQLLSFLSPVVSLSY
jgi:hypothetical protein